MESDFASEFWREQRRGTIGCGFLILILASVPAALLYFLAPSWAFWIAVVPVALFALLMLASVVRELRRTSFFLYESTDKWRTGRPSKRALTEIESIWGELNTRQVTLAATSIRAVAQGVENPHLLGDVVVAMEEQAQSGEEGYWVCVNVLNHYSAELNNLRTLVRHLMPVEPPEGAVVEEVERWLTQMIDDLEEVRRTHVFGQQKRSFVQELTGVIAGHKPPTTIPDAISRLRIGSGT